MNYDVIIVGAGPAGLTAGLYASRARLKTLLIESVSVPGQAVVTDSIENYPGFVDAVNGFELVGKFKKQVEALGAKFIVGDVRKIQEHKEGGHKTWKIEAEGKMYATLSLIIASGARPKKLGVAGEERLQGKGVSYCATCDGPIYKDKDIVLVGGGDSAMEEALFLTRFCKKVTVVHRRDRLRAAKILQERSFANKKMEFAWDSEALEILGEDRVRAVRVKNVKTGKLTEISCEGVFIFVGYTPNTDFVKDLVRLDKYGYIVAGEDMKTSKQGVFTCGDCRQKLLRQIVTACGDGAQAAFSAQQYIEGLKGTAYK